MAQGAADSSSLATWLRQYAPSAPAVSLQDSLASHPQLSLSLQRLQESTVRSAEQQKAQQFDLQHAQQKIQTLRNSLSHFGTHANSLSDRLFNAESSSVAKQERFDRQLAELQRERDAIKALCLVWEGRWREERSMREEAEETLRKATNSLGKKLNGEGELDRTTLVVQKGLRKTAKSRSRSPELPSAESWSVKPPSSNEVITETSVIADLSEEAIRLRVEVKELSEQRDVEIARLEAEIQLRRTEMNQLYSSLDHLVFLSSSAFEPASTNSRPTSTIHDTQSQAPRRKSKPVLSSILDLPAVQAAANHSRSRQVPGSPAGDEAGDTLKLEEEIREMERKIRMLSGAPESEDSSLEPEDGSALPENDELGQHSATLLRHISGLEAQLEVVRNQLEAALRERDELEKQVGNKSNVSVEREEAQRAYIERLEADRSRLSQLLEASEAEALSLSQELSSMHAQVDSLSERVRLKLEEQRNKLQVAYREIEDLRDALEKVGGSQRNERQ